MRHFALACKLFVTNINNMKHIFLVGLLIAALSSNAQSFKLTGHLVDIETGESVLFANCIDENTGRGAVANNFGYFNLKVGGKARITVSCIGYATTTTEFTIHGDTTVTIGVSPKTTAINEVVVSATVLVREQVMMGKTTLTPEMIKSIPSFLAEPDLIKTLAYLPGISLGREGYSNIFVRGGDRGQNLALLDGAPVYNANHLFGYLSVFNSEAIKSATLLKGGFPARYGGRLSSVLDIQMKDGNANQTHGMASIGLLSSQVAVEGPIDERTSYLITMRRAYFDIFLWTMCKLSDARDGVGKSSAGYHFTDFNAKINHRLDSKSQLFASFYAGTDKFKSRSDFPGGGYDVRDRFKLKWHNQTATLRYNRTPANNLFMNASLIYSWYKYYTKSSVKNNSFYSDYYQFSSAKGESALQDLTAKADFDWVTVSPKEGSTPVLKAANEVKVVFQAGTDVEKWHNQISADHYFLQPCSCKNTSETVAYIMAHPH